MSPAIISDYESLLVLYIDVCFDRFRSAVTGEVASWETSPKLRWLSSRSSRPRNCSNAWDKHAVISKTIINEKNLDEVFNLLII